MFNRGSGSVVLALATLIAVTGAGRVVSRTRASCGAKGASEANNESLISISNGQAATECEWTWHVLLKSRLLHFSPLGCAGTLIHREWVLTSAQCIYPVLGGPMGRLEVVAGKYRRKGKNRKTEQSRMSTKIIFHPLFEGGYGTSFDRPWDFALIKLSRPMEMTDCVGTVCLPQRGADVAPQTKCMITGLGVRENQDAFENLPNELQEGDVTVVSNEECQAFYSAPGGLYENTTVTQSMLCAQGQTDDGPVNFCYWDGGGPLVCEDKGVWSIYGAASWNWGTTSPGVFARVHEALDWIEETMAA